MNKDPENSSKFAIFRKAISTKRSPTSENSYRQRYGRNYEAIDTDFTTTEADDIIAGGDPVLIRRLSKFFVRTSGIYQRSLLYYSTLLNYDTIVTPIFNTAKPPTSITLLNAFEKTCDFIAKLSVPILFSHITYSILQDGIYYGFLREDSGKFTIQTLPLQFCRTRFKDFNNLDIPEFDLNYFSQGLNKEEKEEALLSFPSFIQVAYNQYTQGLLSSSWLEIPPAYGGICFYFNNKIPLLIATAPSIIQFEEAVVRESQRDQNELHKLLIHKLPVDKNGELVFELEEAAELHESICKMLSMDDTVDVLTSFGEIKLENFQQTNAAAQSSDRIDKYKDATYNELGLSSLLFNASGSNSLNYSIAKDEALMMSWAKTYAAWLRLQANLRFGTSSIDFDISFLPITTYNKKEMQSMFMNGAQYGYSKMYAGVALGIPQRNLISLVSLENDFLDLSAKMKPLQSSYTSDSNNLLENKKNNNTSDSAEDLDNSGGRPKLADDKISDKTAAN